MAIEDLLILILWLKWSGKIEFASGANDTSKMKFYSPCLEGWQYSQTSTTTTTMSTKAYNNFANYVIGIFKSIRSYRSVQSKTGVSPK